MSITVRMPALAAGATEAAVQTWLVAVGDTVDAGQPIVEIETEKAIVEYEAEEAGTVAALLVEPGASVAVGDPIAVLAGRGESPEAAAPPSAQTTSVDSATPAPARLFASPLVRRLARERGVDLGAVRGSGPHGRIVRRDLDALGAAAPSTERVPSSQDTPESAPSTPEVAPAPDAAPLPGAGFRDEAHTPMRRAIARRLTESVTTVPHFFLTADCRVDELIDLRRRINTRTAVKVSVNDIVLKAVAAAMTDVVEANAIWTTDAIRRFDAVDIGVAVSIPGGLVTPVLRDVQSKPLGAIAAEVRDLAERARAGRLKQQELEGGSFAVSNLGMYGTKEFSAIINPPHAGILAVGAASARPVVSAEGNLEVATVMTVTLSADHRAMDGALAAQWLAAFVAHVENPLGLLV
ncbi:dihydrolipoamide acetyltransferase family protein [Microbacterium aurantiacum]|uniref:Dihydrolipoamide acetyltransferase component of pyruvate dehydrogenase complex n=2 Tax=Microbacterium aurantiacum TaxID=162393 RepID=A0AAJ2LYW4_9MICO|nr:dihydrolipoamide acetyltransferase family protein [Microbacterium aurantiacum]MDS0245803.1 2-oxo acid dehydrogenase subunit E2 [Microbacterium aurantiacum]